MNAYILRREAPDLSQYGWAGALVGFDFLIYEGVIALAAPPAVDTAFDTYQILKHGSAPGHTPKVSVAT